MARTGRETWAVGDAAGFLSAVGAGVFAADTRGTRLGEDEVKAAGGRAGTAPTGVVRPRVTVGGHAFQLNFSNALGTTPARVARGAQGAGGWFVGFNLRRKFH